MAQNQQQNNNTPHSHIRLQYTRYMRHKDRSHNYPTIHSGAHLQIKNYNGIKTITTRNYRLISNR